MDNKNSSGLKIKCTNVNTYGDIATSDETFQTVYDAIEEEEKKAKEKSQVLEKIFQKLERKVRKKL